MSWCLAGFSPVYEGRNLASVLFVFHNNFLVGKILERKHWRPWNKWTAKLGRSLDARQGFLSTVTLEPCFSYSRWTVTLFLAKQNFIENGLSILLVYILGKVAVLLGILILDDLSFSFVLIVNLFILLTINSHLPSYTCM